MATLSTFSLLLLSPFFASLPCPTCSATFITYHCSIGTHNSSTGGAGAGEIRCSAHCRRGIPPWACKRCVEAAAKDISNLCGSRQSGIVWNTDCTVRCVSSRESADTTHAVEEEKQTPWAWWHSHSRIEEIVDPERFNEALAVVTESLIEKATTHLGRLPRFHATGEVMVSIFDTLYAVVECSPSGGTAGCRSCLQVATARAAACCGVSSVAEVLLPGCRLGYDLGPSLSRGIVGPFTSSSSSMDARPIANPNKKQNEH